MTDPYTISEDTGARLSDSASFINFVEKESKIRPWPAHFSFMVPEATYHCRNKVLVGDRSDLHKYFMFLCVDTLSQGSRFTGLYESEEAINGSSVEKALTSNHLFEDITTTISVPSSSPSKRLGLLADVLNKFDVVKVDLSNMLTALALSHVESQMLFAESKAKVIHVEFHVCDHTDYFDLRDRFMNLIELFQYYGYEIYHKEVTFIENLRLEEAGVKSGPSDYLTDAACHVAISWLKRTR